ncbi:hypothetical protein [Intrasporangium flavum]|uniref:hypothetical protein n=1 Tax=Intrasporangium flavum TaxID=1428657 RepID=UPI001A973CA4|nr:hypothetical protein [Intrasporangium flavum]
MSTGPTASTVPDGDVPVVASPTADVPLATVPVGTLPVENVPVGAVPVAAASASDVAALEAEIERLRRRNAELESPTAVRVRRAARTTGAVILVIIGALCLTLSVPAIWARNQVLNTDRYVATMEPLASNADVQASVEAAINRQIAARLDVGAFVEQALPPEAARLKAPIVNAVSGLISTVVHRAVTSEAFATLWTAANRTAHDSLVGILTGEDQGNAVTVSNGAVLLNLGPIIEAVKARLVAAGLTVASQIPAVGATIEIARLQGVDKAQQAVRLLNTVATWLPWIGLAAFAGAIALARGRRRKTLLWAALGTAIGLVVLRIGLVVLRGVYLDQMPTDVMSPQASAYVFDTVTRFLRDGIRLVFIVALVVAVVAILLGRRAGIARAGRRVGAAARSSWGSLSRGPVGATVAHHTMAVGGGVLAVGALVLVLWENPSGLVVLVIAIVVALLLAAVWGMAQGVGRERPAS